MDIPRYPDFDACALTGHRLDCKRSANRPDPFLDDDRPLSSDFEVGLRVAAGEPESAAVVVDFELPVALRRAHANQHRAGTAVFPDIHQRLLDDAGQLAADVGRQVQLVDLGDEVSNDAALLLEASDQI